MQKIVLNRYDTARAWLVISENDVLNPLLNGPGLYPDKVRMARAPRKAAASCFLQPLKNTGS